MTYNASDSINTTLTNFETRIASLETLENIPGFYRNNAPNTQWRAAVTRVKAGTGRGKRVIKSDSVLGIGAAGGNGGALNLNGARAHRPSVITATALTASGIPTLETSVYGDGFTVASGVANYPTYDPRVTIDATNPWHFDGLHTFAGGNYINSNTGPYTYRAFEIVNRFLIVFYNSNATTYNFLINGVAPTVGPASITTTSAGGFTSVLIGTTSASNSVLSITASGPNAGGGAMRSIVAYNSGVSAIDTLNHSAVGATTYHLGAADASMHWLQREALLYDAPDLTEWCAGLNDISQNVSTAQMVANTQIGYDAATVSGDFLLEVPHCATATFATGPSSGVTIAQVNTAYKAWAASKNVSCMSWFEFFNSAPVLMADTVHPVESVLALMGHIKARVLRKMAQPL